MNDELIYKIERINKMLYMLLNEEQKEEIKQFDIEYWESKLKELDKRKYMDSALLEIELNKAVSLGR